MGGDKWLISTNDTLSTTGTHLESLKYTRVPKYDWVPYRTHWPSGNGYVRAPAEHCQVLGVYTYLVQTPTRLRALNPKPL